VVVTASSSDGSVFCFEIGYTDTHTHTNHGYPSLFPDISGIVP
jgi:hypothetical protein